MTIALAGPFTSNALLSGLSIIFLLLSFTATGTPLASEPQRSAHTARDLGESFIPLYNATSLSNSSAVLNTSPDPTLNRTDNNYIDCVAASSWVTSSWQLDDCIGAVDYFYKSAVEWHPTALVEFLGIGAKPWYPTMPRLYAPKRYIYKSCVVALALSSDFFPERRIAPTQDLTSFIEVYRELVSVYQMCLADQGAYQMPGFTTTGLHSQLGVFFWAVGSVQDIRIPYAPKA